VLLVLKPVNSSVLYPLELVSILDVVLSDLIKKRHEQVLLMDMNGNHSLNLGSLDSVPVIQTHSGKLGHNSIDVLLFLLHLSLSLLVVSLKAVLHLGGPNHLDTQQSDLGRRFLSEFSQRKREASLVTFSAFVSHGTLHFFLEEKEPVFDLTLSLDWLSKVNSFLDVLRDVLLDRVDESSVVLIKDDSGDGVEQLLEVVLNHLWVRSDGKNLQKSFVGAEIESWEDVSLGFQVVLQFLLASFKTFLKGSEGVLQDVIGAAVNDVLLLVSSLHDFNPLLVNVHELFGLSWQLLGNITTGEDRHQVGPEGLYLEPSLNSVRDV